MSFQEDNKFYCIRVRKTSILSVFDLPLYPHVKYRVTTLSPSYCLRI